MGNFSSPFSLILYPVRLTRFDSQRRASLMPRCNWGLPDSRKSSGISRKISIASPCGILVISILWSSPTVKVASSLVTPRRALPTTPNFPAESHVRVADSQYDRFSFPGRRLNLRLRGAGYSEEDAELDKAMKLLNKAEQAYQAAGVGRAKVFCFSFCFVFHGGVCRVLS